MENNIILNEIIGDEIYEALPDTLKSLTNDFRGRERDIVLLSSIGVLSACLPNVYGFYDGDEVYANLYVIIIAPPASGKGVMNYSRILVQKIHDKIFNDSKYLNNQCVKEKKKNKDRDYSDCPQIEAKIIPANISSAEMYALIGESKQGVIIIESEADTMSNMLKNDWGNYSDVLRKAFHHEPISISRKMEKIFVDISEPKLSMIMSGTPDQLQPLIKSKDNGLFSRFIIYTFDEISGFKDVFAQSSRNYKAPFISASNELYQLYGYLKNYQEKIEFKLTNNQNSQLIEEFSSIHQTVLNNHPNSFLSNLNRHGLILFRACMIMTVIRNRTQLTSEIICSDADFTNSLNIIKIILKHALLTHNTIEEGILSKHDEDFLFDLKEMFTRKEAVEMGELKHNIPARTVDDKLVKFRKRKAIIKVSHGKYKRILK